MTTDADDNQDDVELTTSVNDPNGATVRERNPEMFGGKAAEPADDGKNDDADAGADDAAATAEADAAAKADTGKTNQRVPISRLNEVIAERESLREKLEGIERDRAASETAANEHRAAAQAKADAEANPPRDFDAEIAALDVKLEDGEIDDTDHRKQTRQIERDMQRHDLAIAKAEAKAEAVKEVEERTAKVQQQTAAQSFQAAEARFFAVPENGVYGTDKIRMAAINVAIADVFEEFGKSIDDDTLLSMARDRVEVSFGGKPRKPDTDDETPQQRVARERRTAAVAANAEASALPGRPAGGMGARGVEGGKDIENMSREEYAKQPQAKRDEMLGKTG